MSKPDLSRLREAVQLRDRCRAAAMAAHERVGLRPSFAYANSTYDAIVDLVREDERRRSNGDPEEPQAPASV
jgi:hypothetical protein